MTFPEDFAQKAQETAMQLFQNDHLNCAEAVFKSILITSGRECPMELFRLASAFGRGMGGAGCTCGALVGGQMAIGAFWGRDNEKGPTTEQCARAAKILHDRFRKFHGATCCRILHKGEPYGSDIQLANCKKRTAESAKIAAEVIMACEAEKK